MKLIFEKLFSRENWPSILLIALLVLHCVPKVKSSVQLDSYINPDEATQLLTQPWLVLPFVPQSGLGRDLEDIGKFSEFLKEARPGQQLVVYGHDVERLSRTQAKAHLAYVEHIQKHREIADSLLPNLVGDYSYKILLTPYIKSNILQQKEGLFERRMVIEIKFWETPFDSPFLRIQAIVLDEALDKEKLLPSKQIFKAGLKAISDKILYTPQSSLSSQSKPDY